MPESINQQPEIIEHLLQPDDHFPNNPFLPLLIYKGVFNLTPENGADFIEKTFSENNWGNAWRNGIYDYHHFHSNTHEVLAAYSGHCIVQFGGEHGLTEEFRTGDVVIIPAGVAHKRIAGEHFKCVGAYPMGRDFNMHYGEPGEKQLTLPEVAEVPLPDTDPVFGKNGPLILYWQKQHAFQR